MIGNWPQAFRHIGLVNAAWAVADADGRFEWAAPARSCIPPRSGRRGRAVDEYQVFVVPAVVGGGPRAPPGQVRLTLALFYRTA
jgi:hypothetical protein